MSKSEASKTFVNMSFKLNGSKNDFPSKCKFTAVTLHFFQLLLLLI